MADIASQDPDRPGPDAGAARSGPRSGQRTRRTFTAAYKARMLAEYDRLDTPGARGALLRREGLYHSHIQNWRKAAQPGTQAAGTRPAGRDQPVPAAAESPEMRKLKKENARLQAELVRSQAVTQALGKLAGLLETLSEGPDTGKP
ncbi:transposase [Actinoplanes sp. NPDC049599]|uniref:transposase n=1 Tax=Actinoplanes sp. NPDC049599 TaxID=3363903 RepID=UPI0037AAB28E